MTDIDAIAAQINQSKKYRHIDICPDTVRDLVSTELKRHKKTKDAIKAARQKLHGIMALYVGDPDYTEAREALKSAFDTGDVEAVKMACARILSAHDSTRERLEIVEAFYARIFAVTGQPRTLLDLACALNPLTYPWMGAPKPRVYAYDIHKQRVDFLNDYLQLQDAEGSAFWQDILVMPPAEEGDVALILKEIPRFEKRQRGVTLPLLDALRVRHVVASVPTRSLSGQHDLTERDRALFYRLTEGRPWRVTEIAFENERVFCVDKAPE